MPLIKERLIEARLDMGLDQKQLAALVNKTNATISRYESGEINVTLEAVEELAKCLKVSPAWLLGWSDEKYYIPPDLPKNLKPVPILGTVTAGKPILTNENIEGYEYSDRDVDFCLKVKGDSMIGARIYDGDIVYVRKQSDVDHGDIAVVLIDGEEATIKRVYKYGSKIVLHPENPTMSDMTFTKNDKELKILGKVIEVKFKVR